MRTWVRSVVNVKYASLIFHGPNSMRTGHCKNRNALHLICSISLTESIPWTLDGLSRTENSTLSTGGCSQHHLRYRRNNINELMLQLPPQVDEY